MCCFQIQEIIVPTDFASIVRAPSSGRTTAVLLDHWQYAQAVLLRGQPIPWTDAVQYAQFLKQAQGLLRPDSTLLDLGVWYAQALAADPVLQSAMAARSRRGFALKTLLADETLSAAAVELATVVSRTSAAPLVVQIPAPMVWLAQTHLQAGAGTVADLAAGAAENAAMYLADWLRRLSTLPVSLLLLDERWPGPGVLPPVEPVAYTPIANVTAHYRWTFGRRMPDGIDVLGSALTGAVVPPSFWLDDHPQGPPSGDFLLAEIPAAAVPETVLARLAQLT